MANLISLSEFKKYKGITSTTQDGKLTELISSVSEFIKSYCGRTFIDYSETAKVEYFDGSSNYEVYLSEFPIISVSSVETSTDGGVTYTALTENTDYFVDNERDTILTNDGNYFVSSSIAFKSLKVTYTGGFVLVPEELKLACAELIDKYREEGFASNKNLKGAAISNQEYKAIPSYIKAILDMHRVL